MGSLFSRAWCVAELAMSHIMGMNQHMVLHSCRSLMDKQESLRSLRVQEMQASRPEDVDEILAKIPDHEEFNRQLQYLIFGTLLEGFQSADAAHRMQRVGRMARW